MFFKKKKQEDTRKTRRISKRELVEINGIRFMATHLYDEDVETGELFPPAEAPGINKGIDNSIYECVKHRPDLLAESTMGVKE